MDDLSPAAQAVLDAALPHQVHRYAAAAALRAVADCSPTPHQHEENAFHSGFYAAIDYVLAIATELEGQ